MKFSSFFCISVVLFVHFSWIYANESIVVSTQYGDILGYTTDFANIFYGIPFAQPPVGELRWSSPNPVKPWKPNIINATVRGAACPQASCNPESPFCPPYFSENCLFLNIFTPKINSSTLLPVMIFIPGGEFESLDASLPIYNSERLVNKTNVILAFVQYRLGVLGFFATGSGPNDLRGNYGLLDQRLGISWLKENIHVFGGDPNQITLFGESAGGQSVSLHYLAEDMQPYFQRAIIQSAPMTIPFRTYGEYVTPGVFLAEALGCQVNNITCLRAATADDIIHAQKIVDSRVTSLNLLLFFESWVPVIDHQLVHGQLYQTVLNVSFPLKPLMIGTVLNEGTLFIYKKWSQALSPITYAEIGLAFFGKRVFQVLERFPPVGPGDQRDLLSQVATEWVFACSTRIFARHAANYAYVFGFPPSTSSSGCQGHVCHGDELPFLFESRWINFTDAGRRVSEQMGLYWTNFAKTENPNAPLTVVLPWQQTNRTDEVYLYFQDPLELRRDYLKDDCDFWDQIGYQENVIQ